MIHLTKPAHDAFNRADYPDNAIFFFDFDGVLADQEEEKLYRLPEGSLERGQLVAKAELIGIDAGLYSTAYLRHLVYQALECDSHVFLHNEAARMAGDLQQAGEPFFIVTARSGFFAVQRLMATLAWARLYPQEVFCLGRSSKADLLVKLRLDWPDRPFVYFEDSQHHIEATKAIGDPNLTIVEVTWGACTEMAETMRRHTLGY